MKVSAGQAVQNAAPPIFPPIASGATSGEKVSGGNSCAASGDGEQTGLFSRAQALLSNKKYMLSALAGELNTQKSLLKGILEANGYEISGPAQWVKQLQPA